MTKSNETEINIKGLCVQFPDKNGGEAVQALKDVHLAIKEGSFVSLLGPSGCGKTTLLRSIADLQEVSSGIISVKGRTPKEVRLSQRYGIVFQNPVLYDWRTVRRNICLPMEVIVLPKPERTRRVDEVLELVGLTKFGKKYPHQLSG